MNAEELIPVFQVAHACFNAALLLAFGYQGRLGWRIRSTRIAGGPQDFAAVRRHRALGPRLAALLPLGYLAGLATVYLHRTRLEHHPAHLAGGTALLVLAGAAFLASRSIRGPQSPWRTPHFALGAALLCTFLVQVILGLDILL